MVDIFKRMRKEAEEKKQKEKEGYSALFAKRKPVKENIEVKAWTPLSATQKPVEQEPGKKPAVNSMAQKKVITEAVQKIEKKAGNSLGRYFEVKKTVLGVGGTTKEQTLEVHCFAEEVDGRIHLYLSSQNGKPTQIEMGKISPQDFAKRFKPCSEHNCPFN